MPENDFSKDVPQFGTASYSATTSGTDCCFSCNQTIAGLYYRVNGKMACGGCTERLRQERRKSSHPAYLRGLLFGVGAAIVGLILYASFTIATGFYIGYVSLAVGWMIGKAIMMGSKGIGGRHYQIAAILLTYAAVSMAEIPIVLYQIVHTNKDSASLAIKSQPSATAQPPETDSENASNQEQTAESKSKPAMSLSAALGRLALLGLASPFLELQDPFHGVIGLIILLVGMRIAWKITQDDGQLTEIHGPYGNTSAASA